MYCTWNQNIVTKETHWCPSSNWKNAYKRPLITELDLLVKSGRISSSCSTCVMLLLLQTWWLVINEKIAHTDRNYTWTITVSKKYTSANFYTTAEILLVHYMYIVFGSVVCRHWFQTWISICKCRYLYCVQWFEKRGSFVDIGGIVDHQFKLYFHNFVLKDCSFCNFNSMILGTE